jgi:hypothetical protein
VSHDDGDGRCPCRIRTFLRNDEHIFTMWTPTDWHKNDKRMDEYAVGSKHTASTGPPTIKTTPARDLRRTTSAITTTSSPQAKAYGRRPRNGNTNEQFPIRAALLCVFRHDVRTRRAVSMEYLVNDARMEPMPGSVRNICNIPDRHQETTRMPRVTIPVSGTVHGLHSTSSCLAIT